MMKVVLDQTIFAATLNTATRWKTFGTVFSSSCSITEVCPVLSNEFASYVSGNPGSGDGGLGNKNASC